MLTHSQALGHAILLPKGFSSCCHFANIKIFENICCCCCLVAEWYLTLLQPHGLYSSLASSVHWIFHAGVTGGNCHSLLQGSSWPKDQAHVSCIGRQILHHWATRETVQKYLPSLINDFPEKYFTSKYGYTLNQGWIMSFQQKLLKLLFLKLLNKLLQLQVISDYRCTLQISLYLEKSIIHVSDSKA